MNNGDIKLPEALKEEPAASSLLEKSVLNLPGVGEKFKDALEKLKIFTFRDVVYSFPYRYEVIKPSLYGEKGVLSGVYENHGIIGTRRGKRMLKAIFRSEKGFVAGVWLHFKGDYPANTLKKGEKYYLYGNISKNDGMYSIFHPEFVSEKDIGSIRPVYSAPAAMPQTVYRKAAEAALKASLEYVTESLPANLLNKYGYPNIKDALRVLHSPETEDNVSAIGFRTHPAFRRFIYEEFFYLQIAMELRRLSFQKNRGIKFKIDKEFLNEIKELMPFRLTSAQRRALVEIFNDMISDRQMNRLVQGDVGSGKTIIAFIAAAAAVKNGYQAIIIAPTEVLAEQHFRNLRNFLKNSCPSICLMTGSVSKKDKTESKNLIAAGAVDYIIGTHAILEENVEFANLGLVIVDEQHRFGVRQRKVLMNKGTAPDIILMTATPIPRTLAMTLYGDLDASVIDEMPPGRIPCVTKAFSAAKLNEALDFVKGILDGGGRAYFIYPLIDESDKSELKAATQSYEYIKKYFKNKGVGLLHGKMKADEKRSLLEDFKSGTIDVLVSTTVVEVGVDAPEATVMVIENAERFGLSQLHQLRGRVGRNDKQSYCVLITSKDIAENGRKRVNAMLKYTDGFKLAEIDLELRGQGDFFGTKQSGLPEFKFADLLMDMKLLLDAKNDARETVEKDPSFESEENKVIAETLKNLYGGASYIGVG